MIGRRLLRALGAALVGAVLLTGCSYVNRVAARLNSDGSLDFATCDRADIDGLEVNWEFLDLASNADDLVPPVTTPLTGDVHVGDVFRLEGSAPEGNWVNVTVNGVSGGSYASPYGQFSAADLASGDWVWNQTGVFVGTVDVQHCDLDLENVR
jgi:hypothetical protein